MRRLRPLFVVLAAAPLVASLTGCVVVPAHRYRGYDAGYDGGGPAYGGPPVAGYIWFEGVWEYRGGGRRWVPGHWGPRR
ncbi:hypothetical protein [Mitsuaria sp. GD03876]|uniref:hypothetical protein n=1 Tax=Mitsuaria sp. GD03876 TaxID=2975399 RepID=UPI00244D6040|nr:hypothetical protein [Mitsuaria sp. GD03876]MDH0864648.1 hypothetical protein [Mitsuaria sp. GD03876]